MTHPYRPHPVPTGSETSIRRAVVVGSALALTLGLVPMAAGPAAAITATEVLGPDLRVDADRDGLVGMGAGRADEIGEDAATALFLPNLDDDSRRCSVERAGLELTPDARLDRCHDAADVVVNGAADAADLARVRLAAMPDLPDDTTATLDIGVNDGDPAARVTVFLAGPAAGSRSSTEPRSPRRSCAPASRSESRAATSSVAPPGGTDVCGSR